MRGTKGSTASTSPMPVISTGWGTPIRAASGVVTIAATSTTNSNVSWDTSLANSSMDRDRVRRPVCPSVHREAAGTPRSAESEGLPAG